MVMGLVSCSGDTEVKEEPDAATSPRQEPTTEASDGGEVIIGESVVSVVDTVSTDGESKDGDSAFYANYAFYFQNSSTTDVASGGIKVELIDKNGATIHLYDLNIDSTETLRTGVLTPKETGALAGSMILAAEPVELRLSVEETLWEPFSDKRHGECTLSDLASLSGTNDDHVGFTFSINSTYPAPISYISPIIMAHNDEGDLVGGGVSSDGDARISDVKPGEQEGSLVLDSKEFPTDFDINSSKGYCLEPNLLWD